MLVWLIGTIFTLVAPYTKVEESFNVQAIHDLLVHSPFSPEQYDHFQYPGVVPRTFIAPLFFYAILAPFHLVLSLPKPFLLIAARLLLVFSLDRSLEKVFFS